MTQRETVDPRQRLAELHHELAAEASVPSHERLTDVLIACGELEAGVVDGICAARDDVGPEVRRWREVSRLAGEAFYRSVKRETTATCAALSRLRDAVARLLATDMPVRISVGVPEGYAYYALYPEAYIDAAARFWRDARCARAVVIGLRSIGTSLSAVVAAALSAEGCDVETLTLRPRGHPFDRRPRLAPDLADWLSRLSDAHFVVVDEGPGLSGSSMSGTAALLEELGVDSRHIVLLPSWLTDGGSLLSEEARARWRRHAHYVTAFETIAPFALSDLVDWSAGRWRGTLYDDPLSEPAVHPSHERRKYRRTGPADDSVLKFVGLSRYGRRKLVLAEELAAVGFSAPVRGLTDGFLSTAFVAGRPLAPGVGGPGFLDTVARYLAFRARAFAVPAPSVSFDELLQMIEANTREALGETGAARVGTLARFRTLLADHGAVAIDGRMLPHEWLVTDSGYVKTDAVDHHADHFLPGCQDVAWDLAGAAIEHDLDAEAEAYLLHRYTALTGDRSIATRVAFHAIAYLAYRVGYVALAARGLAGSLDGARFERQASRYQARLRDRIARLAA